MSKQLLTAFEVEKDVRNLRNSMKGMGTDEETILEILGNRTPQQMVQIINGFKKTYETTLSDEIQKELSGNFGNMCYALSLPILEFDITCVHEAMNGWLGANDSILIEVLVGRTEKDMGIIKTAYVSKYSKEIEDDVRENLTGEFRKLFLTILNKNGQKSDEEFDADADVEALYKASDGRWGHDKATFIEILGSRTNKQLNKIFYNYEKKYNKSILSVIRGNFSGRLQNALANIAKSAMNRVQLIAELFENALFGISTKNNKLIRLVVRHRSPPVMKLIKQAYFKLYDISLEDRIKGESHIFGYYEDLLMACINGGVNKGKSENDDTEKTSSGSSNKEVEIEE